MATELIGVRDLHRKLSRLASAKEGAKALRDSVATPMRAVRKLAKVNLAAVSPGVAEFHTTYRGRIVSRGFAARSLVVLTGLNKAKTAAFSKLGVKREAFYALQFFELGTATIPKREWLVPAFEAQRSASLTAIGATLKKHIEKIARSRAAGGFG